MTLDDIKKEEARFLELTEELLSLIDNISSDVRAHVPPSSELRSELVEKLDEVDMRYRAVVLAAKGAGITDGGKPVEWYVESVVAKRREIEEAVRELERFITVGSDVARYDAAIEPYRSKAKDKLSSLAADTSPDFDKRLAETESSFLKALEMGIDELDSEAGMRLLDELDECFKGSVIAGLARGKYREGFHGPDGSGPASTPIAKQTVRQDSTEDFEEPFEALDEESAETDNLVETPRLDDEIPSDDFTETAHTDTPSSQNDANRANGNTDGAPTESSSGGPEVLHCLDNLKNVGKTTSKGAFEKQLQRMNESSRCILALLSRIGGATCEAAAEILSRTRQKRPSWSTTNGVNSAAKPLAREGLISLFALPGGSTAMCLTTYGSQQLSIPGVEKFKDNGKSMWAIKLGEGGAVADESVVETELQRWTANSSLLAVLLKRMYDEGGYKAVLEPLNDMIQKGESLVIPRSSSTDDAEAGMYIASTSKGVTLAPQGCVLTTLPELVTEETVERLRAGAIGVLDSDELVGYLTWAENHGVEIPQENDDTNETDDDSGDHTPDPEVEELPNTEETHQEEDASYSKDLGPDSPEHAAPPEENAIPQREQVLEQLESIHETSRLDASETSHETEPGLQRVGGAPAVEDAVDIESTVEMRGRPNDEGMYAIARQILDSEGCWGDDDTARCAVATAFAKAASLDGTKGSVAKLALKLALAVDSPLVSHAYTVEGIAEGFTTYGAPDNNEGLLLATYCQAMLRHDNANDKALEGMFDMHLTNYDEFFPNYPELKELFRALNGIHSDMHGRGFSKSVVAKLGDGELAADPLADIVSRASQLAQPRRVSGPVKGVTQAVAHICAPDSELTHALLDVAKDNELAVESIKELVKPYVVDDVTDPRIDEDEVEAAARQVWKVAVFDKKISKIAPRKLGYESLEIIENAITDRISVLCDWLTIKTAPDTEKELGALRSRASLIRKECEKALQSLSGELSRPGQAAIRLALRMILARLDGDFVCGMSFDDFLKTGFVTLDDRLLPVLTPTDDKVEYFEPWRRILKHVMYRQASFEEALDSIKNNESPSYANIRQLSQLMTVLDRAPLQKGQYESAVEESAKGADAAGRKFKENLEMWFNDGRIDDEQRESLASDADDEKERIYSLENFGCWYQLLSALERQSLDIGSVQFEILDERLSSYEGTLREGEETSLLDAAKVHLHEEKNYSVVENYLNWFDMGVRRIEDVMPDYNPSEDDFATFMSDDVFDRLYGECSKAKSPSPTTGSSIRFKNQAKAYVRDTQEDNWTDSQLENSYELILNWPSNRGYDSTQLNKFLTALGLSVGKCSPVSDDIQGMEHFRATLLPMDKSKQTYKHPIAMFGTHAVSSIDIVVSYENLSHTAIVDLATAADASEATMVIVDYHIDRPTRRQVAEACKNSGGHPNTFLLVDRVLLLYLALAQRNDRLSRLLKCTLPFTYHQPFTLGKDLAPDEMFCGRVTELNSIIGHGGACFVYGGRRLGKSALLNRAASLVNRPDKKQYAVRVDLFNCETEEQVAKEARSALNAVIGKRSARISPCKTLAGLCNGIERLLEGSSVDRVLLLLDEADGFLATIEESRYKQLHPLVKLHQGNASFKFVLAGTHNVARASSAATEENGIWGQLGKPECIKPLPPRDALRLLRRPLMYLGYHIDSPNIETILTKTNYYPGLVQLLGYKLVESMSTHFGTYYSSASGHPPCPLSKRQLASILADTDVNEEVKREFLLSLELDDRYMFLARAITALYYELIEAGSPTSMGLSLDDILEFVREYGFDAVNNESDESIAHLLFEMAEMGVLTRSEKDGSVRYRIRRKAFLGYIGDSKSVWSKLDEELPRDKELQ